MSKALTTALADHITFGNAQRKLGVSRNHLKQLVREHNLRTYRLSDRVLLLRLDEVRALLEGVSYCGDADGVAPRQRDSCARCVDGSTR